MPRIAPWLCCLVVYLLSRPKDLTPRIWHCLNRLIVRASHYILDWQCWRKSVVVVQVRPCLCFFQMVIAIHPGQLLPVFLPYVIDLHRLNSQSGLIFSDGNALQSLQQRPKIRNGCPSAEYATLRDDPDMLQPVAAPLLSRR
jgi:hypothetical protein